MATSKWSIDRPSGHCAHADGLQAYIDSRLTASGGLRCVGPFATGEPDRSADQVLKRIFELSVALESIPEYSNAYVVWGAYSLRSMSAEMNLLISSQRCGWIPNLAVRSEAILSSRVDASFSTELLRREWSFSDIQACVVHRSGVSFQFVEIEQSGLRQEGRFEAKCSTGTVDPELFCQPTFGPTIRALGRIAFSIFRANNDIPLDSTYRFIQTGFPSDDGYSAGVASLH